MQMKKTLPLTLLILSLTTLHQHVSAQVNMQAMEIIGDILTCNDFANQSVGIVEGGMPGTLTGITYGANTDARRTECYFFDSMFNVAKHRNIFGGEMNYNFDHLDRMLSEEVVGGTFRKTYLYNGFSNLKRIETLGALPYVNNADPDYDQHFVYNDLGLMEKQMFGRADGAGNLQSGVETRFQYNDDDAPAATITSGGGGTCVASRDASGKPTRIVGAGIDGDCSMTKGETILHYDPAGSLDRYGPPELSAQTRILERNGFGQPTQIQHPESGVTELSYFPNGAVRQEIFKTAPGGDVMSRVEYTYDAMGRTLSKTDFLVVPDDFEKVNDSRTLTYEYDDSSADRHIMRIRTQGLGGEEMLTSVVKDGLGRMKDLESTEQPTLLYDYTDSENKTSVVKTGTRDPISQSFADTFGRPVKSISLSGSETHYNYSPAGPLSTITLKQNEQDVGITQRLYYDKFQQVAQIVHEVPNIGSVHEGLMIPRDDGKLDRIQDGDGNGWQLQYDDAEHGWLAQITDPQQNNFEIVSYNNRGEIRQTVDGRGTRFFYTYNDRGQVSSVQAFLENGGRNSRVYQYDAAGQLIGVGDSNNQARPDTAAARGYYPRRWNYREDSRHAIWTEFQFDSWGRKLEEKERINSREYVVRQTHGILDMPLSVTHPNGLQILFDRENIGILESMEAKTEADGSRLWNATLDFDHRVGALNGYALGNNDEVTFLRDAKNRLVGWEERTSQGIAVAGEKARRNGYGDLTMRLRDIGAEPFVSSRTEAISFGRNGFQTHVESMSRVDRAYFNTADDIQIPPLGSCERAVGNDGCRSLVHPGMGGNERKEFIYEGNQIKEMTLDLAYGLRELKIHNQCSRMSLPAAQPNSNCAQAAANATYTYDRDGNGNVWRVRDAGGQTKKQFHYDAWDRMVKVELKNHFLRHDDDSAGNYEIDYHYDGLNRLVMRQLWKERRYRRLGRTVTTFDLQGTQLFLWNGGEIVQMQDTDSTWYGSGTAYNYVQGPSGIMARIEEKQTVKQHLRGLDGSLLAIRDYRRGTFEKWFQYGAYGETRGFHDGYRNTPADRRGNVALGVGWTGEEFLFRGAYRDPVTEDYLIGGHWYQPSLARFLTRTAPTPSLGNMNLYRSPGDWVTP